MIELVVELSNENLPLATAELEGAVEALGGALRPGGAGVPPGPYRAVTVPDPAHGSRLAVRLSLARRLLAPWTEHSEVEVEDRFRTEGTRGLSAAMRPLGGPGAPIEQTGIAVFAGAYLEGGGQIDLDLPARRYYLHRETPDRWWVAEETAVVDRQAYTHRRMPRLPFRRPVSLPPKLGRVAVNLAAIRPGDRVVDPFVGTGALALEAALLGARVTGVDRDPAMVKGAIQNLAAFGLSFESVAVADAEEAARSDSSGPFDALVTDPPDGRSSGMAGEARDPLLRRVLPPWAEKVRATGRVVVVLPGGGDPLGPAWRRVAALPDRVHRSLTREFRVYRRGPQ